MVSGIAAVWWQLASGVGIMGEWICVAAAWSSNSEALLLRRSLQCCSGAALSCVPAACGLHGAVWERQQGCAAADYFATADSIGLACLEEILRLQYLSKDTLWRLLRTNHLLSRDEPWIIQTGIQTQQGDGCSSGSTTSKFTKVWAQSFRI